jgi:glycosyltransferase involved in cell wall biosynthesis
MPHYGLAFAPPDYNALPTYPIDLSPLLAMPFGGLDETGVLYNAPTHEHPGSYQPTSIAQFALAHWNAYLETENHTHMETFLRQARWLLDREVTITEGVGGWPIDFAAPKYGVNPGWLSALTQGNVMSVLVRAHLATGDRLFLDSAHRAARTFELDVLDGGVQVRVGDGGIFFEEVAAYPAMHILNGYILAIFGLYDYVAVTHDDSYEALIRESLRTFHNIVEGYDAGFWSYYDLLHKKLATKFYHALHISLLRALAHYSGCEHCVALANRWTLFQRRLGPRFRYWVASRMSRYVFGVVRRWRPGARHVGDPGGVDGPALICVPITAFPIPGGMRSVLQGVAGAMHGIWKLEYLTHKTGADQRHLILHRFGGRMASQWYMPTVWLYCLAGWRKLTALVRHGHRYRLIVPQDGVFTGAFAALTGKLTGVPVICMDHGNVTLLHSPAYHQERIKAARAHRWPLRWVLRIGLVGYLASLRLMARFATRYTDHFLVAGDEVEAVYRERFGVPEWRITRYPYVVDSARLSPPSASIRTGLRRAAGIPDDGIVITMINRLAPEKGLDIAMRGIGHAVANLPAELRARVRVIIAGDGPLRQQVEADRQRYSLEDICALVGEANSEDVARLLALSDIFLYAGTRGTNYSMAVLEAMVAGCAVVATVEPRSNAHLLAESRGIAIPVGHAHAVSEALTRLVADPVQRERMRQDARLYVLRHHGSDALRRCLLRATYWPGWSGQARANEPHLARITVSSHQAESL